VETETALFIGLPFLPCLHLPISLFLYPLGAVQFGFSPDSLKG